MMSVRQNWPKTRRRHAPFEISLSHGNWQRSLSLRPSAFYALVGLVPLFGTVFLAVSLYFIFHDDMVAALISRTSAQQASYVDRLTALHAEITEVTSARSRDQAAYEGEIRELAARQAEIEQHAVTIAALADRAGLARTPTGETAIAETRPSSNPARHATAPPSGNAMDPLLAIPGGEPLVPPQAVSAFAPIALPHPTAAPKGEPTGAAKPQPLAIELRSDNFDWIAPQQSQTASLSSTAEAAPIEERLGAVRQSLDKLEKTQMGDIVALGDVAQKTAAKLHGALADTGLEADRLKSPPSANDGGGVGGPFIPVQPDAGKSPFERAALELQDDLLGTDRLEHLLPYLPLRQPLAGPLQVTSPFGTRIDPFFGRLALHPGVDLRQSYGSPVFATAAGKVTVAAPDGGYGNLVEIDHGNGLVTRYAHLATMLVSEGQMVKAGDIVGKIGTTGRTTGPHLHYEVRIDGEPVDPMRFLKAGMKLSANE